jgi:hypothetical protein
MAIPSDGGGDTVEIAIDPTELLAVLHGLISVHVDMVYEINELKRRIVDLERTAANRALIDINTTADLI